MTALVDGGSGGSLLLVDDDDVFRERLAQAFTRRGYAVEQADGSDRALLLAGCHDFQRAVVDLRMPGQWGLHVVRSLLERQPEMRIVVLTAYGSIATALEAVRLGAINFLQKPATVDEIERALGAPQASEADAEDSPPASVPSLARAEWEHINRVLTQCNGNVQRAAAMLGVHRRTLQRKLSKYPVKR